MKKKSTLLHQLIATTFLVVFLGVYGLDFACSLRMRVRQTSLLTRPMGHLHGEGHAHQGHDHQSVHELASSQPAHEPMPSESKTPKPPSCCKDHTAAFFASLSVHKVSVPKLDLKKLDATPIAILVRIFSGETWAYTKVRLGVYAQLLKPKIPDRRILFCSLTI